MQEKSYWLGEDWYQDGEERNHAYLRQVPNLVLVGGFFKGWYDNWLHFMKITLAKIYYLVYK